MPKPFYTICAPVSNTVDTIPLSIESDLGQICEDWQRIIADDYSAHGT